MCLIWAEEAIVLEDLDECEVEKKNIFNICGVREVECDVYYHVWDELKVLSPLGICTEISKDVQLSL